MKHPVIFVGAGPGDPELITVKGRRLLQEADCIVYAGSLVPQSLLGWAKPTARRHDSASLTLEEIHVLLKEAFETGHRVVRLHTGDPSLYGAVQEQMALLEKDGIPYEVVPGVSAVFAAAASLRKELTLPGISQTVILTRLSGRTPVPEAEDLRSLATHRATMAIYLSVGEMETVVSELSSSYPPATPVVVAYRVGWPDETFLRGTLEDIASKVQASGIRRQALILIGQVLDPPSDPESPVRSRLYDETFSHGYRKAGNRD